MTYLELKTLIADTLNRQDLTSVIPSFIKMAEANIARKLDHWRQERRVSLILNEQYESLPGDFLRVVDMFLDDGSQLDLASPAQIADGKVNKETGKPRYYTINSGELEFFPAPDISYGLTMVYRARVPDLDLDDDTNWVLKDYLDIYLYSALAHSAPYLKEDERVGVWASLAQAAILEANKESLIGKHSGSKLVMRKNL